VLGAALLVAWCVGASPPEVPVGPILVLRPEATVTRNAVLRAGGALELRVPVTTSWALLLAGRASGMVHTPPIRYWPATAPMLGVGLTGGVSYLVDLGPALLEGSLAGGLEWTYLWLEGNVCTACGVLDHLPTFDLQHTDLQATVSAGVAVVVPLSALSQLDVSFTLQLAGDTTDPEWHKSGNIWIARMGLGLRLDLLGVLHEL